MVTWTATVAGARPGVLWYRFRGHRVGQNFRILKDYGPNNTLDWTASDHDGSFEIEVAVRNVDTTELTVARERYDMRSLAAGGRPVITPTVHPLVFLYSAPPCAPGSRMRVQFRAPEGTVQSTPFRPCRAGLSMNFYLAGMRPETEYSVFHVLDTGSTFEQGPVLSLITGAVQLDVPERSVVQAPPGTDREGIVLHGVLFANPIATDLKGNLIWYYPTILSFLTRPERGGYFFGIIQDPSGDPALQVLREFDLVGMTVRETNAARVNEQLALLGRRAIDAFHHEARRLPDGRVLVLAGVEQIMTGVQGPDPVNVLGEMIIVMDADLQVVWTWDAFDHLDASRRATLDDICAPGVCPPLHLAPRANDWIHANSVAQTPDGHLLLSMRSQDWVIKIDYGNGEGGGDVIWRLGKDGDFRFDTTDPYPWFSHQHDPEFDIENNDTTLTIFDNGNTRRDQNPSANSRGQVIRLDERNRVATLLLNVDLGQYSFALGSAQTLANGNFHFDNGFLPNASSMSIEVDPSGKLVYALQTLGPAYRSFRMPDLYTPH